MWQRATTRVQGGGCQAPGGPANQPLPLEPGQRHPGTLPEGRARAIPQLQVDLPPDGQPGREQQDPHAAQRLSPREEPGRDYQLAALCHNGEPVRHRDSTSENAGLIPLLMACFPFIFLSIFVNSRVMPNGSSLTIVSIFLVWFHVHTGSFYV